MIVASICDARMESSYNHNVQVETFNTYMADHSMSDILPPRAHPLPLRILSPMIADCVLGKSIPVRRNPHLVILLIIFNLQQTYHVTLQVSGHGTQVMWVIQCLYSGINMKSTPQDYPDRASSLRNLRNQLGTRFKRTNSMDDLSTAPLKSRTLPRGAWLFPHIFPSEKQGIPDNLQLWS